MDYSSFVMFGTYITYWKHFVSTLTVIYSHFLETIQSTGRKEIYVTPVKNIHQQAVSELFRFKSQNWNKNKIVYTGLN